MNGRPVPVVIVGAGPTGIAAATLLAQYGVESLVLERWESIYPQPRAVHLDDEIYRILARLGIADEFARISRLCRGLRLVDRSLRVLAEFGRQARGRHGYPEASMFDQPELESLLRANLGRHPIAIIRGNTEATGLAQDGAGLLRVECTDRVDGGHYCVLAHYVLGCDGANSMTRNSIGATMQDLRFQQRWLVADIATTTDLGQWEGVQQVCDPHRAATYMRVSTTHHRWEFRLLPGETADDYRCIDRLHRLIAPWTRGIGVDQLEIMRVAEYTFRAQVADRWRDRQVFLLGDAAHLTPPFIGQGMGAGMRDAMNLAWKLAGVLRGDLPGSVLETYQAERKPHVRTMIRRAELMGIAMTAGGEAGSLVRRVVAPRLQHLSGLRLPVWDFPTETPPLGRSDLAVRPPLRRTLAGRLCPNARLDEGRRFDDVAAGRFAVVTCTDPSAAQRAQVGQQGGALVVTPPGSELDRWLRRGRSTAAIVRPDATVLRAGRDLSALCAALPASSAHRATPVSTLR
ncbi:MAG: bifunctional 3-(3-hydroxy-phenyl)propionate/3-hydroxycinnamic acid hydroxylase [Pseudonocardiales bacterium]|nr:bifunctional 3-(3-hydroxy-phenyl)propionate/3-hydroxycinnamic acid hydroxylase [Pseudonocardiales bacterium]